MKKTTSQNSVTLTREPAEDEIRDYAYHLYQQSGCAAGHDLENWLEAKACLEANVPLQHARVRLHRHRHGPARQEATVIALEPPTVKLPQPVTAVGRSEKAVKELPAIRHGK